MDYEEPSNVLLPLVAIRSGVYAKTPIVDEPTFEEINRLAHLDKITPFNILSSINNSSVEFPRLRQLLNSNEKTAAFWQWAILHYMFTGTRVFKVGVYHKPEKTEMNYLQRAQARKMGNY